jgi:hypothetical protein
VALDLLLGRDLGTDNEHNSCHTIGGNTVVSEQRPITIIQKLLESLFSFWLLRKNLHVKNRYLETTSEIEL